jgi:hypothetical protein
MGSRAACWWIQWPVRCLQVYYTDPEDEDHTDVTHGCVIDWFPGKDLTVRRMLHVARRPPLERQHHQSAHM